MKFVRASRQVPIHPKDQEPRITDNNITIDRGGKLQHLYEGVFHDAFLFQNHVYNQLYNYCNST